MRASCSLHPLPYQTDPAVYFEHIRHEPGAILLDSGRPVAQRGRFDILSAWPTQTLQPHESEPGVDFFNRLRAALQTLGDADSHTRTDLPFCGGLIGYLAYDFGRRLEPRLGESRGRGPLPDAQFGVYDWALISDHLEHSSQLMFHPACPGDRRARIIDIFSKALGKEVGHTERVPLSSSAAEPNFKLTGAFQPSVDATTYQQAISSIHRYIEGGDCYQVNYTQRFQAGYTGDPWVAYCALREACPTPFAGYVNLADDAAFLSLSPERFIRLHDRHIETRPIKGTRPRGDTPDQDRDNAQALCRSIKDRAENLMIVDLMRNDIGRSSQIGSVSVPELFSLETYPNVHHLVSSVCAELAPSHDAFDLLAGCFPGGSITGAPKIRAMQIIDELEPHGRSLYCGSLVYVDVRGEMDSSITIRSLVADNGRVSCWGGGGIVMDSDWQDEYRESITKVDILMKTLQRLGRPTG